MWFVGCGVGFWGFFGFCFLGFFFSPSRAPDCDSFLVPPPYKQTKKIISLRQTHGVESFSQHVWSLAKSELLQRGSGNGRCQETYSSTAIKVLRWRSANGWRTVSMLGWCSLYRNPNCKIITFTVTANAEGVLCAYISVDFCGKGVRSLGDPLIPRTNHSCADTQQHRCT